MEAGAGGSPAVGAAADGAEAPSDRTGAGPEAASRPPGLLRHRGARVGFLAGVGILLLVFGYALADVLNPLLIALLLAYILNPVVSWLERRRVPRTLTIALLYLAAAAIGATALAFALETGASFWREATAGLTGEPFADLDGDGEHGPLEPWDDVNGNGLYDRGLLRARVLPHLQERLAQVDRAALEKAGAALEANAREIVAASGGVYRWATEQVFGRLFRVISFLVLVPIYTFFILRGIGEVPRRVHDHLPGLYREQIWDVLRKVNRALSAFFRGRLIVALVKGLITALGLLLFGVRFWLPIGGLAALLSIVPFLGPIVALLLAAIFGYHPELWAYRILGTVAVLGVAEVVEAVLTPAIIGREVGLHPVTIIVSIFAFGELLGLFGVLMAVPCACVVKILFTEFVMPNLEELARERPAAAG